MDDDLRLRALALVRALKVFKVDAPLHLVAKLVMLADEVEKAGFEELAKRFQVLVLIVTPVDDHATRPAKFEAFAEAVLIELEKALMQTAASVASA